MKAIDPNAVIDAIARLFPHGFEMCEPSTARLAEDLAVYGRERLALLNDVLPALEREGRLMRTGVNWFSVSFAEQARRVLAVLGLDKNPSRALLELAVANVLAGKTEKRA